jgi:hypothetical protein
MNAIEFMQEWKRLKGLKEHRTVLVNSLRQSGELAPILFNLLKQGKLPKMGLDKNDFNQHASLLNIDLCKRNVKQKKEDKIYALRRFISSDPKREVLQYVYYDDKEHVLAATNGRVLATIPHEQPGGSKLISPVNNVKIGKMAGEECTNDITFPNWKMVVPDYIHARSFEIDIPRTLLWAMVLKDMNSALCDTVFSIGIDEYALDPRYVEDCLRAFIATGTSSIWVNCIDSSFYSNQKNPVVLTTDNNSLGVTMSLKRDKTEYEYIMPQVKEKQEWFK